MSGVCSSAYVDAVQLLAPQIRASVAESERTRRLPLSLVKAMAQAGLFRLWIPRAIGGEEADPITFARVVEAVSRIDGATGWCLMIGGAYGAFGGLLPTDAARHVYGSDPLVITGGVFRPSGRAVAEAGGYRVTGRWAFGSGCQHCAWIVGGCQIFDGDQPQVRADGAPVVRFVFFPVDACHIHDTWDSVGLRGTGSHDYSVSDLFVPAAHTLSLQEPPIDPGAIYQLPFIALTCTAMAAVPLGIARHAIDILIGLAGGRIAVRSRRSLSEDAGLQANLGRAEALVRSGRAFLFEALDEAWQATLAGELLTVAQRATLWLASTHATAAAKQAAELMFSAGGSASVYVESGMERCVRDIHAAAQHAAVAQGNYEMVGQALLGADMSASLMMRIDGRGAG